MGKRTPEEQKKNSAYQSRFRKYNHVPLSGVDERRIGEIYCEKF